MLSFVLDHRHHRQDVARQLTKVHFRFIQKPADSQVQNSFELRKKVQLLLVNLSLQWSSVCIHLHGCIDLQIDRRTLQTFVSFFGFNYLKSNDFFVTIDGTREGLMKREGR
jgi:hypothetical protein